MEQTTIDDLVEKLRQAKIHRQFKRETRGRYTRFRMQRCLQDAVNDVYRNALMPINAPYFSFADEDLHFELWDIKRLACGGDVQQAKLYISKCDMDIDDSQFML